MLAATSSVVAFLIQIVSIAHPRDAEGRTGLHLRLLGIGMVVASLLLFAIGVALAASTFGNLFDPSDVAAQHQLEHQREGTQTGQYSAAS